jgi:uncharacterized protein (DUF849 family)
MLIQAALNGGRTRSEHPAIPCTPEDLAASAKQSVAAGAGAEHFHVRSRDGRGSLGPDDVALAVEAVRAAIPSTPFGVRTGAWIIPDTKVRHQKVAAWTILPNFASVNFHEQGAAELAALLLSRGVAIEAGLIDARGPEALVRSYVADRCLRIMLETQEETTRDALRNVEAIEAILDRAGIKVPRLLHGLNATAWTLLDAAMTRGYDTRIGFEDVTLPDGSQAPSNEALVAEAVRRASRFAAGAASL